MPRLDPKRPLAIYSPEWTSLDIPERLWMVGRVITKFNAQATEFCYFSKIRNSKCPHEDPLKRVAVKTSANACGILSLASVIYDLHPAV